MGDGSTGPQSCRYQYRFANFRVGASQLARLLFVVFNTVRALGGHGDRQGDQLLVYRRKRTFFHRGTGESLVGSVGVGGSLAQHLQLFQMLHVVHEDILLAGASVVGGMEVPEQTLDVPGRIE